MVKVFLLGRPGSGKTTAFRCFEKLAHTYDLHATRFREYTILYDMFKAGRSEFRPVMHGGFDIVDFSILNMSAQLLEKQVQEYARSRALMNEVLFLELVRDDYKQAMQCFSRAFLQESYFLYVEADVETCIQRIRYRVAHPTETDSHFVSEHILRDYYAKDNKEYMATRFKIDYGIQKEVQVIENSSSSDDFTKKFNLFADAVLAENPVTKPV